MQNYKIMNIPKMRICFTDETAQRQYDGRERILSSIGGTLLVDGEPVHSYYGNGMYYWEKDGEKGCIWLRQFGLMGEGFIERDGVRSDFRAVSETGYRLFYTNDTQDVELTFYVGVSYDASSGSMIYCKLDYGDTRIVDYREGDPEQNILSVSLTKDSNLHIDADLSTLWSAAGDFMPEGFYACTLSMDFDATFNHVTGTVTETTQNGGSGKTFTLKGKMLESDLLSRLRRAHKGFRADSRKSAELKEKFLSGTGNDSPCSIDELFSLKEPSSVTGDDGKEITGQAQVQNKAVETLYYLAVYYTADMKSDKVDNVTYQDLFGITKEYAKSRVSEISDTILDLLDDSDVTDFLMNYANVSIGNSIAKSTDQQLQDAIKDVSDAERRCRYYMSDGSHDGSMEREPGFNTSISLIVKYVYASLVPNLKKYYEDSEDWGKKLYDYAVARMSMLKASDLAGTSRITHIAMMLTFLDDEKHEITYQDGDEQKTVSTTYGAAFYMKAYNLSLAEIADEIDFDSDGHSVFISIMEYVFGVMYDELQKEESDKFSDDILKELKEELSQFSEMTREDFIDSCINVTEETLSAVGTTGDIIQCISTIGKQFADNPSLNFCGKIVSLSLYAFTLFSCANMFADWEELTTEEKAENVCVFISGIANAGNTAVKWKSLKILLDPDSSVADRLNAATRLKFGGEDFDIIAGMGKKNGTDIVETMEDAGRYVSSLQTTEGVDTQLSRFTKVFRVAEITLRIVNVLVLAFSVVITGFDIADDFKYDRSAAIKAMDLLNIMFTGAACILEGVSVSLDLAGVICDAIPVIGAVCMVLGFVFSIISVILKAKDKQEPPVITFIKDKIVPFLKSLAVPPDTYNGQQALALL